MVARVQPDITLIVTFQRAGEEPEYMYARNGAHAWDIALHLITQREELQAGDTLTVRRADGDAPHADSDILRAPDDADPPPELAANEKRRRLAAISHPRFLIGEVA
jgi:hypothetical protein